MLPEFTTLTIFIVAAMVLLITPGPAVVYIVTRSIDQGRMAGIVSALGVGIGGLFHVAAAALGLSALLVSSALAFNLVKYLGAAYLIFLGVRKLLAREEGKQTDTLEQKRLPRIFLQGVVVNLLNPKTALFFFAFLPQFIDVKRGAVSIQILLLGIIFVTMGICSDGTYAILAGTVGHWLKGNLRFLRAQRYFSGSVYILLGVVTAISGSGRKG